MSEKQQNQWRIEYFEFCKTHQCKNCGSGKISKSLMGRPYMPYVQFHKKLSNQLGYTTLILSGCTSESGLTCAVCKSAVEN